MEPIRPVPDLSVASAVFGDIQYMPPYSTVEARFKRHYDPHVRFISGWFFGGLSVEDRNRLTPRDGVDADKALRAISAVMRSFEPKHEHKEAGCAQLLHDWFILAPQAGQ